MSISGANPGDFDVASACVGTLKPGGRCLIVVDFVPTASGSRTATLKALDSSGNGPAAVTMTGTGR